MHQIQKVATRVRVAVAGRDSIARPHCVATARARDMSATPGAGAGA